MVGSTCQASDIDSITHNTISFNSAATSPKFAFQLYGAASFVTNSFNDPSSSYELAYFDSSGNILDARYNYWPVSNLVALRGILYDNFTNNAVTQGMILFTITAIYPAVGITIETPWPLPGSLDSFKNSSLCTLIFETPLSTGTSNYYLINPPDGSFTT